MNAAVPACEKYWWQDPAVLLGSAQTICPKTPCRSEAVNALTRTFVVVLIVGAVTYLYGGTGSGVIALSIAGITAAMLSLPVIARSVGLATDAAAKQEEKEGFVATAALPAKKGDADVVVIGSSAPGAWTMPTPANPFMNVLLPEYGDNPGRFPAMSADEPSAKQSLNDFFRTQWFSDPTDVFGRNQSQRQFIAMPSTSIPNDRESYQNWLYNIPGKTCKEGGRARCLPATDGGPVAWLNFNA